MKRRAVIAVIILVLAYVVSYMLFRQTHSEIWERDGKTYVIFPENKVLYYFYRPLSIIDERFTEIRSHIGQH